MEYLLFLYSFENGQVSNLEYWMILLITNVDSKFILVRVINIKSLVFALSNITVILFEAFKTQKIGEELEEGRVCLDS